MKKAILSINKRKNEAYSIRKEKLQGKEYIIVPVTMMVEGVHHGSHGKVLHTINDLGMFPASWDGRPVVINHPQDSEGNYISANSPEVIEKVMVGQIYNTTVEGSKLKAEAWLDPELLEQVSPEAYEAINDQEILEVSVGVFTEDEEVSGDWNGEQYSAIARNHRPDHLALLPGGTGACSVADGCGIRANSKHKKGGTNVDLNEAIKLVNQQGFTLHQLQANGDSFNEISDAIRQQLYAKETKDHYYYLEDVFSDKYIYAESGQAGRKLYSQKYLYSDGVISNVDDPVEVTKKVDIDYEPVSMQRTKFSTNSKNGGDKMSKENCGACMEKVIAIINSNETQFTKDDREWLLAQDEAVLDKLMPKDTAPNANAGVKCPECGAMNATGVKTCTECGASMTPKKKPAANTEAQVQTLSEQDKAALEFGKKALKAHRDKLIKGIQDNTAEGIWSDETLAAMNEDMLEKVYNSVNKSEGLADYSALSGGKTAITNNGDSKIAPMGPTGIDLK